MRKVVIIILILSGFYSYCQVLNNDKKLIEAFGQERYSYLVKNYPDSLQYYDFILTDGFDIMLKKYADVERLSTATPITIPSNWIVNGIPQKSSINIFKLPVVFNPNYYQYYLIEGTEYVLRTKSLDYIHRKFQAKPNK